MSTALTQSARFRRTLLGAIAVGVLSSLAAATTPTPARAAGDVPLPIAFYPFDEEPLGRTATDVIRGVPGEATLVGFGATDAAFAPGTVGNGICFNGSTQFARAPLPTGPGGARLNDFTVSAWVRVTQLNQSAGWETIVKNWGAAAGSFHLGRDGTGTQWSIQIGLVDALGNEIGGTPPWGREAKSATGLATAGEWVHVVSTVSSTDLRARLYVNGVEQTTGGGTSPAVFPAGGQLKQLEPAGGGAPLMSFGVKLNDAQTQPADPGNVPGWLNGCLDEIAFWDVALTPAQVLLIEQGGRAGTSLVDVTVDPPVIRPASTPTPQVDCTPDPVRAGETLTCVVSGGPADTEILWNVTVGTVRVGAGLTLDGDGAGVFTVAIPRSATGQDVIVELVEWAAPVPLGVVGGPVPGSVPAGNGPSPMPLGVLALTLGLPLLVSLTLRSGRRAVAGRSS
jgi:hypothetical protein